MAEPSNAPMPGDAARHWGMLCHLAAAAGMVVPFANLIAPLALWWFKRGIDPYVDAQGKEAVNFQLTMTLLGMVCVVGVTVPMAKLALTIISLGVAVLIVIAAVKVKQGKAFRYPWAWRVLT